MEKIYQRKRMSLEGKTPNSYLCFSIVQFKVPSLDVLPTGVPFSWPLNIILTFPGSRLLGFPPQIPIFYMPPSLDCAEWFCCASAPVSSMYTGGEHQKPGGLGIHSPQGKDILLFSSQAVFAPKEAVVSTIPVNHCAQPAQNSEEKLLYF